MRITDTYYLVLAAMIFTIGAVGVLTRRNVLVMFMCVELMLNAVNLTFVSFANTLNDINGQVIVFFTLTVAAAEVAVGLAIIVAIFRIRRGATADDLDLLRDRPSARPPLVTARDLLDLIWIVPRSRSSARRCCCSFGKRIGEPVAGWIATALMGLAFVWSLVMLFAMLDLPSELRVNVHNLFTWVPAGTLDVKMGFHADPLSITWILLVTGVGTLIHLYSIGYMHGDPRFSRFFAYLNLFAASMLILVLGSSFLLTFLGWEGVGLCSYLLISFWFERNAAAVAGKKAFVTNRVGDVGFLLAMFLIFATYRSLDYTTMGSARRSIDSGTATAIALLLLVARHRQERAVPAAPLAPRRDGRPHAGLRADPRRDDGHRGRVPALPRAPVPRGEPRRDDGRRVGRRRSPRCSRAPSRSCSPTSNGCSRTPPSASSATCSSRSASTRTRPRSSW